MLHVDTHHGSFVDSVARRAATTRTDESARSLRRNIGDRDHSSDRCAPAARSAGNCTADTSPRLPPCPAHAALDNAADCGHKDKANACFMPRECRRPGVLARNVPGPSLIRRPSLKNSGRCGLGDKRLTDRAEGPFEESKTNGEQFWGCCASIPKSGGFTSPLTVRVKHYSLRVEEAISTGLSA